MPANDSPALLTIGSHPSDKRLHRLECRQWLPASPERLFPFFADAFNLEAITPPWLHFHVLSMPPIEMRSGLLIDYRLRLRGLPLRWQSEIQDWHPPHRFVDEMRRGPYRHWRHTHTFEPSEGGTAMLDVVDYAVPGGSLVNALFVRRDLLRIFDYRRQRLRELFPAQGALAEGTSPAPAAGV
jgi:ligand-binding SRPBCC domain-containing protein